MSKKNLSAPDIPTHVVDALLPGAGFFGVTPENCLKVEVGEYIDFVEISVEAPTAEILNIGEINFEGQGGDWLPRENIFGNLRMSTIYGGISDERCCDDFLAGRLLHTQAEQRPSLKIHLNGKYFIRKIHIKNRNDIYGVRSRHLVVRTFLNDRLIAIYKNFDYKSLAKNAAVLLDQLDPTVEAFCSKEDLPRFIIGIRKKIIQRVEQNKINLSTEALFSLLPLWDPKCASRKYFLCICAHILLAQLDGLDSIDTRFLRKFSSLLSTDILIDQLAREAGYLLKARGRGDVEITISRHEIHESRLINRKDSFLNGLVKVIHALSEGGISVMLGYGTLLGAVRNGSFMAHDDDVDLIYFDGSKSKDDVEEGKARIIELLTWNDVRAWDSGYGHLHTSVNKGIGVDLFPMWQEDESSFLAMENLQIRSIPFSNLIPTSTVKLYDLDLPAPAKPKAFLADRYGEGWLYPDPYYEWPWQIDRVVTRIAKDVRTAMERRARLQRRHWGRICRVAWGQQVRLGDSSPPMNSLPVISVARQTGFDAVELDVRISCDEVPVLGHDDKLLGPDGEIVISKSEVTSIKSFRLGRFSNEDVNIPTLEDALIHAKGLDVQIDARISPTQVSLLRGSVERAQFDPTRLQFCVYNIQHARALLVQFPESVLMWKSYQPFLEIDDYFLDEAKALGLDGVMLSLPPANEDYSEFMEKLRDRGLRVLFFIHSGDDNVLRKMIRNGVDYVTTVANDSPVFRGVDLGEEGQ